MVAVAVLELRPAEQRLGTGRLLRYSALTAGQGLRAFHMGIQPVMCTLPLGMARRRPAVTLRRIRRHNGTSQR